MHSLSLASAVMFIHSIINLLLLKSYHCFWVWNVLVSFLNLIIWYDFSAWCRPFLILLSGDVEGNPDKFLDKAFQFVAGI